MTLSYAAILLKDRDLGNPQMVRQSSSKRYCLGVTKDWNLLCGFLQLAREIFGTEWHVIDKNFESFREAHDKPY